MKVLITGGAGFIGSTVASKCVDAGIDVVILDNLLTGRAEFAHRFPFYCGDIADEKLLDKIFTDHPDIGATVHCAALIVVGDSVSSPARVLREQRLQITGAGFECPSERVWALRIQFLCRGVRAGQGRVCRRILADRTAESLRAQQSSVRNHARRHRGSNRFVGDISPILQSGRSRSGTAKRNTIGTPDARTRKALRIIFDRNTFQSDRDGLADARRVRSA